MVLQGVYTALITPFRDGKVDYAALKALLEKQVAGGVAGLVAGLATDGVTVCFMAQPAAAVLFGQKSRMTVSCLRSCPISSSVFLV